MKSFISSCAVVALSQAIQLTQNDAAFEAWAVQHGRSYADATQRSFRQSLWKAADTEIKRINADPANTFEVGHNHTSDFTPAEFQAMLSPPRAGRPAQPASLAETFSTTQQCNCGTQCGVCACNEFGTGKTQIDFDWRYASNNPKNLSAELPITDQGNCGSCWAFADAGIMEITNYLTNPHHGLVKFSEQQIVSCNPMRYGCNGGWDDYVFTQWMIPSKVKTVLLANYPYIAKRTRCEVKPTTLAYPTGLTYVYATDNPQLYIDALMGGPLNVWIRADTSVFQYYKTGILNNSCCLNGQLRLNHVVVLVGYSIDINGNSAWIIRNSWAGSWGRAGYGYIKITPQGDGICGEQNTGYTISVHQYTPTP